uniref:Uncharacterized protein n=1 Tax=Alexandrium catenella TaxID=2925 RepID=A0A7S1QUI3_ALECA|mmetsp:Transcript_38960/g.105514  ORF Transcript_38960/g.105514 Transcript_38960/m.105514 type:complete len:253 (+) Transcript_38960:79-837(+)
MARSARVSRLLLSALWLGSANAGEDLAQSLAADDECLAGGEGCSLNALQQLRAADPEDLPELVVELPGGGASADLGSMPDGFLARLCNNGGYCVMGGYSVVAGRSSAVGMESINAGNVRYYDVLMYAAVRHCSHFSCVLITNPMHHRTQSRFHINYRHVNDAGANLKRRMEMAVCGNLKRRVDGWRTGHFPCGGRARFFRGFPEVFSAAMGAGSLAHAAVSVWPGSCLSGDNGGTIILVSFHCSIEHTISNR